MGIFRTFLGGRENTEFYPRKVPKVGGWTIFDFEGGWPKRGYSDFEEGWHVPNRNRKGQFAESYSVCWSHFVNMYVNTLLESRLSFIVIFFHKKTSTTTEGPPGQPTYITWNLYTTPADLDDVKQLPQLSEQPTWNSDLKTLFWCKMAIFTWRWSPVTANFYINFLNDSQTIVMHGY